MTTSPNCKRNSRHVPWATKAKRHKRLGRTFSVPFCFASQQKCALFLLWCLHIWLNAAGNVEQLQNSVILNQFHKCAWQLKIKQKIKKELQRERNQCEPKYFIDLCPILLVSANRVLRYSDFLLTTLSTLHPYLQFSMLTSFTCRNGIGSKVLLVSQSNCGQPHKSITWSIQCIWLMVVMWCCRYCGLTSLPHTEQKT